MYVGSEIAYRRDPDDVLVPLNVHCMCIACDANVQGDGQPAGGIRRLSQQELAAGVPVAKTNGGLILMRPIGSRATTAHVGIATELLGPLHVEALRSSHFKLLERHEALRSVFQPRGQGQMPLMRVRPASEQLQQFSVEEAGDEAEAREIAAAAWYGEYDTDQGPLTRLQVRARDHPS